MALRPFRSAGGALQPAAERLEAFFKPRLEQLQGGDRGLAQASESVRLCAALKDAHSGDVLVR